MDQTLARVLQHTISELEKSQMALENLRLDHESLSAEFSQLQYNSIDTVWRFFPTYCDEFRCLPSVDLNLKESSCTVGGYRIGQTIGQGQFSDVYKCIKEQNGNDISQDYNLAIKVVCKSKILSIDGVLKAERELAALQVLCATGPHPNIVMYEDCLHGRRALYIITEEIPLDLFEFMKFFRAHLNGNIAAVIARQLISGLSFMHNHCISHGDIKPENILVDIRRNNHVIVKLCDFGLCSHLSKSSSLISREFSGTSGFYAPETLVSYEYCGYKADIFSLGCVCMEILLNPEKFRLLWLSAYAKAKIVSRSYMNSNPNINSDFVFEIKTAIESVGVLLLEDIFLGDEQVLKVLVDQLNFHPGSRPALNFLGATTWVNMADESTAYSIITEALQVARQVSSCTVPLPVSLVKRGKKIKSEHNVDRTTTSVIHNRSSSILDECSHLLLSIAGPSTHSRVLLPSIKQHFSPTSSAVDSGLTGEHEIRKHDISQHIGSPAIEADIPSVSPPLSSKGRRVDLMHRQRRLTNASVTMNLPQVAIKKY